MTNDLSNKSLYNKINEDCENQHEIFVSKCTNSYFMQSIAWSAVKGNWEKRIVTYKDEKGTIKASMLILIKKKGMFSTAYSPRGPVCEKNDLSSLKAVLELALECCRRLKVLQLKIDPIITENEHEKISIFQELGFNFTPGRPDYSTLQPRGNYIIANISGKTEDEILMSFKQKTRYNIKIALKRGVECKFGSSEEILTDFYNLLVITGKRDGFQIRQRDYYKKILTSFKENARIYVCYYENKPISAALCINYARRTYYVFGASDNYNRNVMPTYLMQWEMIKWAIKTNCDIYDFMGIPATVVDEKDSMVGVLRFKKGFCGEEIIYSGEFDYDFNGFASFGIKAAKNFYAVTTKIRNRLKNIR